MKRILMLFFSSETAFFFLNDVAAVPPKEELNRLSEQRVAALSTAKGLKGSVESVIDNGGEEGGGCLTSWCIKLLLINLQAL